MDKPCNIAVPLGVGGRVVAEAIGELCCKLARKGCGQSEPESPYMGKVVCEVSLRLYLARWLSKTRSDVEVVLIALAYVDRVVQSKRAINARTVHRLLLAALVLASKWLYDVVPPNSFFAVVGGVPVSELCKLETQLLVDLNFSAHISNEEYMSYRQQVYQLCTGVARKMHIALDDCTYHEMCPTDVAPPSEPREEMMRRV